MRFMMFVRADKNTGAGAMPSKELIAGMGRFNEEMVQGIARITFSRGKTTIRQVFEAADVQ